MNLSTIVDLQFDHMGMAVANGEAARKFLGALGYEFKDALFDPLQGVHLQMCEHTSMPAVELIWPDKTQPSPIGNMLKKRDGLVYHLCYRSRNVEKALAAIEALGLRAFPVDKAKPAVLFGGQEVSFYQIHGVGLIEIIHET